MWIDQFGPQKSKTKLMTYLQVGVPLGIVFGYVLTSLIKQTLSWHYSFIIQSIAFVLLIILTLFVPNIYFSSTHQAKNIGKSNKEKKNTSMDTWYIEQEAFQESGFRIFFRKFLTILTYKVCQYFDYNSKRFSFCVI